MTDAVEDIDFIRDYKVSVARLWAAVTRPDEVVKWFGPEGVALHACDLDLTRTGAWYCDMVGRESGDHFIVSGQVTHVRPPDGTGGSVGFTWAWQEPDGTRGAESHVIFEVTSHAGAARLRVVHRNLGTLKAAQDHSVGWLSTLRKLDQYLAE